MCCRSPKSMTIAENILAQQISRIPGVAQVALGGQQKPAVRVQVDPSRIAALGIQLEDIASVITTATVDAPKGSINGTAHSFAIYDNDQLLKAAPWNDVIVAYRNGAPVRIRDIGVAVDGPENVLMLSQAERPQRHAAADLQAGRRERHRHGQEGQRAASARDGLRCRLRSSSTRSSTARRRSRPRSRRRVHPDADDRAGRHGDLPVPAQPVGDDHSRRHGAAGVARALRRSCTSSATPSTTSR